MGKNSYASSSLSGHTSKRAYKTDPQVYPPARNMVGSSASTNCKNCMNCCPLYPYGPFYVSSNNGSQPFCIYNSYFDSCCCDPTTGKRISCPNS